ncbi:MAG: hypothetical protein KBI47_20655 [Armatimonadetes bacterium]|nr:hypothetical protein [Armatimonadota bacterium]
MVNETKQAFVAELGRRFGRLRKLDRSQSLFELADGQARIYIRYSKVHDARGSGWYGLRAEDLRQLEGHPALVCFLWEGQAEPLLVPFAEYEPVIEAAKPASDGQYKVHILLGGDATELYIARIGRFNVEGHMGWNNLEALVDASRASRPPELSHQQVQTLLGAIGTGKGYDVWVPASDRAKLDWSLCQRYECDVTLPPTYDRVSEIIREVDVLWVHRGSGRLRSAFEIEHSTPIYSGLLRFNDIHLVAPDLRPTYTIVANDARRDLFARQLGRPTFEASGLGELCSFLEYADVFNWHSRVKSHSGGAP